MTNYLENKLLDHVLNTASYTMPSGCYLGLFTAAPSDAGGGTELSGNGYARQDVTFGAASSGTAANTSEHTFTADGGDWGEITHWAIFDASTSGNMLLRGEWQTSRTILNEGAFIVEVGQMTVGAD